MSVRGDATLAHVRPAELTRGSHWEDPNETRVPNWLTSWDGEETIDVGILSVPLSRAAIKNVGTNFAPNAMRENRFYFTTYATDFDVDLQDLRVRDLGDVDIPLWDIREAHERIEAASRSVMAHEPRFFPVFIGGDHSITRPLIKALHEARPELGRIGIVHFDAHLDAQVLDFAGPHNGTIMRGLLDEDDCGVRGENIVEIGITGFGNAAPYRRYLEEHGATIFTSRDVARRGIDDIIARALEIACKGTDGVYVTFDIDCMDVAFAPGTGASSSGGLTPWQAMDALFELGRSERVVAFDLAELDPTRDFESITVRLANKLLLTFLAGLHSRAPHRADQV